MATGGSFDLEFEGLTLVGVLTCSKCGVTKYRGDKLKKGSTITCPCGHTTAQFADDGAETTQASLDALRAAGNKIGKWK